MHNRRVIQSNNGADNSHALDNAPRCESSRHWDFLLAATRKPCKWAGEGAARSQHTGRVGEHTSSCAGFRWKWLDMAPRRGFAVALSL